MTYRIDFSKDAETVIRKWKKSNKTLFEKLRKILNGITYSRRITAHDRIIYNVFDDIITVVVIEVEGHYNDK